MVINQKPSRNQLLAHEVLSIILSIMKVFRAHITALAVSLLCILLCVVDAAQGLAQTALTNTGTLLNIGTISIKRAQNLVSTTPIVNRGFACEGTLVLSGLQTSLRQDTLHGWTRFVWDAAATSEFSVQRIPAITYANLALTGRTVKTTGSTTASQRLIVLDSLLVPEAAVRVNTPPNTRIEAQGFVLLRGTVNGAVLALTGTAPQLVAGNGVVEALEANNSTRISLLSEPTAAIPLLTVANHLDLVRGDVANTLAHNFRLADNARITRAQAAFLAIEPRWLGRVSVRYVDAQNTEQLPHQQGSFQTLPQLAQHTVSSTGELPTDTTRLVTLEVLNEAGVRLTKSVTVLDTLRVRSHIDTDKDILSFRGTHARNQPFASNPEFLTDTAEIIGSFRRFVAADTLTRLMNNRYTTLQFPFALPNQADTSPLQRFQSLSRLASVVMRVLPDTPPLPDMNPNKVRRSLRYIALDAEGRVLALDSAVLARVGYAWRVRPADETGDLERERVLLQRWTERPTAQGGSGNWQTAAVPLNRRSVWNRLSESGFWVVGVADSLRGDRFTGQFALGVDSLFGFLPAVTVRLRAVLEGAVVESAQPTPSPSAMPLMSSTISRERLLPSRLPNMYPYSLLGARRERVRLPQSAQTLDSLVDWVVVEFRRRLDASGLTAVQDSGYAVAGLLTHTGSIVEADGKTPLVLQQREDYPQREFFVVLHHRNHLAVSTALPLRAVPNDTLTVDFTVPHTVLGGVSALKRLDSLAARPLYGLIGGDADGNGVINRADYDVLLPTTSMPAHSSENRTSVWQAMFADGYSNADTTLDGVVNTRDANVAWNNRGAASRVPLAGARVRR